MEIETTFASQPARQLADGYAIPLIGFGTYKNTGETVIPAVETALEVGYRHIDTAALYGNEREIGQALKNFPNRSELFVTSKLRNGQQPRKLVRPALEASLERLGLDYLDLYLIHWPAPQLGYFVEAWEELLNLKESGLVRSIGVSNFMPQHLIALLEATGVSPAVNQIEHHPTLQQQEIKDACILRGIVVEAYAPLGRSQSPEMNSPVVAKIAAELGVTPAQVILRWAIEQGVVVIPKSVHGERITSNFDVFSFSLTQEQKAALDALESGERTCPFPPDFNKTMLD